MLKLTCSPTTVTSSSLSSRSVAAVGSTQTSICSPSMIWSSGAGASAIETARFGPGAVPSCPWGLIRNIDPSGASEAARIPRMACEASDVIVSIWLTSSGREHEPCRYPRSREENELCGVDDGDRPAPAAGAELHHATARREDRMVAADADAGARAEAGPALADDDLAAVHRLAGEDLDAEVLRVGVAAVPARSESLLMSHLRLPPSLPLACSRRACALIRRRILWPPTSC